MSEQKEKVNAGTITRTIVLALALFNQVMSATGHAVLPIEDADVEQLVSSIFTIAAAGVTFWKNNSFTKPALEADKVLKELKNK